MGQRPAILESHRTSSDGVIVLLADDLEAWRAQVRSFLESKTQWKVVEASDGLEAVQKAVELHPDVVLLDLSMPGMNGIEAAKKIRELSPNSRIIFLSGNTDEEVMSAALETGAAGYVVKSNMSTQLIPVAQAALRTHIR
jgi:DNA-binding NarL/FixJ family response regulator